MEGEEEHKVTGIGKVSQAEERVFPVASGWFSV